MQVFIAELSNQIDQGEFEKSWHSEDCPNPFLKVDFAFTGRRISMTLEPGPEGRWQSDSVDCWWKPVRMPLPHFL